MESLLGCDPAARSLSSVSTDTNSSPTGPLPVSAEGASLPCPHNAGKNGRQHPTTNGSSSTTHVRTVGPRTTSRCVPRRQYTPSTTHFIHQVLVKNTQHASRGPRTETSVLVHTVKEGARGQTTKHGSPERIDANASLQLAAPSLKSRRLRAVDRVRN